MKWNFLNERSQFIDREVLSTERFRTSFPIEHRVKVMCYKMDDNVAFSRSMYCSMYGLENSVRDGYRRGSENVIPLRAGSPFLMKCF